MIKKGSLYHATDKAVFDALCQHKLNRSVMKQLFLRRGILSSKVTNKEKIALYFSRLNHDLFDHRLISETLASGSQRERTSSLRVNGELSLEKLELVGKNIKKLQQDMGNKADYHVSGNGIEVKVHYQYIDHRKSEFQQLVSRDAVIVIENDGEGVNVRWPSNDYVETNIKELCIGLLMSSYDEKPEVDAISLVPYSDSKDRSKFFKSLINSMDGYELVDVTDVYVFHPENKKPDSDLGIHISKASLKGMGVLLSREFKDLESKDFYIVKISWTVKEKDVFNSDLYSFEAQFRDPEDCSNFAFLVKGFQKYISLDKYERSIVKLDGFGESRFSRLIERSARHSMHMLSQLET